MSSGSPRSGLAIGLERGWHVRDVAVPDVNGGNQEGRRGNRMCPGRVHVGERQRHGPSSSAPRAAAPGR